MAGRARPSLVDFAFGDQLIESVQTRAGGAIEMHFAEDCGFVAGLFQLLRESGSCRIQRSEERRYAGGVRHLAREERLARWPCRPAHCSSWLRSLCPSEASRSRLGVSARRLPSQPNAYPAWSSAIRKTKFGFFDCCARTAGAMPAAPQNAPAAQHAFEHISQLRTAQNMPQAQLQPDEAEHDCDRVKHDARHGCAAVPDAIFAMKLMISPTTANGMFTQFKQPRQGTNATPSPRIARIPQTKLRICMPV